MYMHITINCELTQLRIAIYIYTRPVHTLFSWEMDRHNLHQHVDYAR